MGPGHNGLSPLSEFGRVEGTYSYNQIYMAEEFT